MEAAVPPSVLSCRETEWPQTQIRFPRFGLAIFEMMVMSTGAPSTPMRGTGTLSSTRSVISLAAYTLLFPAMTSPMTLYAMKSATVVSRSLSGILASSSGAKYSDTF